jgi:transposase
MTKQRRSFTPEFKREAADLVLKQNYSYIEASRSLGIGESALRRWVDQIQKEHKGVTPQSKALTPEQPDTCNKLPATPLAAGAYPNLSARQSTAALRSISPTP